jgi:acyl-CoA-binding protein
MTLDERFAEAQRRVTKLPARPGNDRLLEIYALYKQGQLGDVQGGRPGLFELKGRAKWDAWARLKGVAPEEAKRRYVELVDRLEADGR